VWRATFTQFGTCPERTNTSTIRIVSRAIASCA
jgi:hypothetical protein